jgi:hypothetical protein
MRARLGDATTLQWWRCSATLLRQRVCGLDCGVELRRIMAPLPGAETRTLRPADRLPRHIHFYAGPHRRQAIVHLTNNFASEELEYVAGTRNLSDGLRK